MSVALSLAVAACGFQEMPTSPTAPRTATQGVATPADATAPSKRLCTDKITNTTALSISQFFVTVVRNVEGPATFCLTLQTAASGSGASASNVTGTLRVEFEDDFGIKAYETSAPNVFYGYLTQNSSGYKLELILADDYGLVFVDATASGSAPMTGTIKSWDFPSYEDQLAQQVADMKAKCQSGQLTVAQCLGYNYPPTQWWNQPPQTSTYDKMLADARTAKADATKTHTLGNISFDLGTVLNR